MNLERFIAEAERSARLAGAGQHEPALALCEELIDRYKGEDGAEVERWLAYVMLLRGRCLLDLGDVGRLLAGGGEMRASFAGAANPYARAAASTWMADGVRALIQAGRPAEAIALSAQLSAAYEHEADPESGERIGQSLTAVGHRLVCGRSVAGAVLMATAVATRRAARAWLPESLRRRAERALASMGWEARAERHAQAEQIFSIVAAKASAAHDESLLAQAEIGRLVTTAIGGRPRSALAAFENVLRHRQAGVAAILRAAASRSGDDLLVYDLPAAILAMEMSFAPPLDQRAVRRDARSVFEAATGDRSRVIRRIARGHRR